MAERRMFTKKVTDADDFIALGSPAQALYLHLVMGADDDGFNNQVQIAMFKAHASVDDLKLLMVKRFILQFDNGVIVIKHWRMANALRKDRYTETAFRDELAMLDLKDNGAYTLVANRLPDGCQVVATDKDRLEESSLGKESKGKDSQEKTKRATFSKPSLEEVTQYINDSMFCVDPDAFYDYYEANGWMVGNRKMKDWKATVRNWDRREQKNKRPKNKELAF